MAFVNKMDRTGADFYRCVDMMKSRLGAVPLVIQLPLGAESDFLGLIDLVEMKQLRWKDETLGAEFVIEDINESLLDDAKKWREQMIEIAVDQDDKAMEDYLDGKEPDIETLNLLFSLAIFLMILSQYYVVPLLRIKVCSLC